MSSEPISHHDPGANRRGLCDVYERLHHNRIARSPGSGLQAAPRARRGGWRSRLAAVATRRADELRAASRPLPRGSSDRGARGHARPLTTILCPLLVTLAAGILAPDLASASPTWSIQPAPNPAGATNTYLQGVSCPAATTCTAVGYNLNASGPTYSPVAERWSAATNGWSLQTAPNQGLGIMLHGVSCPSTTTCTGVGQYLAFIPVPGGRPFPFRTEWRAAAEQWGDETGWTIQAPLNPSSFNTLYGVSCSTWTACIAVGRTTPNSVTLAEHWDGSSWSLQPSYQGAAFSSSSCSTPTACTAVGYRGNPNFVNNTLPFAEGWDGNTNTWSFQTTAAIPPGATLSGVSCTAPTACTAVGQSANHALAERWDGVSWSIQLVPNPPGATSSTLTAVSCTSPTSCTAVGNYVDSSGTQQTLAEHWVASTASWLIEPTPNPAGANSSTLAGVSCTTTACTAVGDYVNSSGSHESLAEVYSG